MSFWLSSMDSFSSATCDLTPLMSSAMSLSFLTPTPFLHRFSREVVQKVGLRSVLGAEVTFSFVVYLRIEYIAVFEQTVLCMGIDGGVKDAVTGRDGLSHFLHKGCEMTPARRVRACSVFILWCVVVMYRDES